MATDTRNLQLQISASAELMIRNLKAADNAVAEFQNNTNRRLRSIDDRFDALGKLKGKLGGLSAGDLLGAATGASLIALAKRGLDYSSSLQEVSQQLGVTTKDLQEYRFAATQTGIEQEVLDKGLAKLTVTLGQAQLGAAGPTKAFAALGLSLNALKGKTAGDVIPLIAEGLGRIPDPAKRAAIEIELFGRAGQKLDTLLAGGRGQIDELRNAAQRLGLVLSDDAIANADEAADKLSAVKQVLEANIAGVVAENAGAITQLAGAFGDLAVSVIKFLKSNPEQALSLAGAIAGGAVGGIPGAGVGAVSGFAAGQRVARSTADANLDRNFRLRQLRAAQREVTIRQRSAAGAGGLFSLRSSSATVIPGTLKEAQAEELRQRRLFAAAAKAGPRKAPLPVPPPTNEITVPKIFGAGGGRSRGGGGQSAEARAREAASAARRDVQDRRRADDLAARGTADLASARADLSLDPEERLRLERERIDLARAGKDADLENAALDNRYVAANIERLKSINADVAAIDKTLLDRRRAQEIDETSANRQRERADDAVALLQIESSLTNIAKDRRAIERRILEIRQREERAALERVVADRNGRFSADEKGLASDRLARLPALQNAERAALDNQNQGELENFVDRLRGQVDDINAALDGVGARGLQSLEDGLVGVITGTESVASAFKKLAASIIADLVRIAVQKAIVSAASSIFGFSEGGQIPGFAGGGSPGGRISGPGTGTSDSILAILGGGRGAIRVSNGEFIVNERATRANLPLLQDINAGRTRRFAAGGPIASVLPRLGGGGASGGSLLVQVSLSDDLNARIDNRAAGVAVEVVRQSAPQIVEAATNNTVAQLRRPRL